MRLILHIGRPKTGTTSLQQFLYLNRETLSQSGFLLFDGMGVPNNSDFAAYFSKIALRDLKVWYRRRGLTTVEEKDLFFRKVGFRESLDSQIKEGEKNHHTALITSEQLSTALRQADSLSEMAEFVRSRFTSVQVVCFFRNQVEVIASGWTTALRGGRTLSLRSSLQRAVLGDGLDYYDFSLQWEEHFGLENLSFHVYQGSPEWDVRKFFWEKYLDAARNLNFPEKRANRSFGVIEANLVRGVNVVFPYWLPGRREPNAQNLHWRKRVTRLVGAEKKPVVLSPRQSNLVHGAFRESNRLFAERFLPPGEAL